MILIYQENHTFDDVFGQYCKTRKTPCDGYAGPVTFADAHTAANIVQPDIVPAVVHSPKAQRRGLTNQWDQIGGCQKPPNDCVSHSDPANIPNLVTLANRYVVSDRTFAAGKAASLRGPCQPRRRHVRRLPGWSAGALENRGQAR